MVRSYPERNMTNRLMTSPDFLKVAADVFAARGDDEMWQMWERVVGSSLDPFARDGLKFSQIGLEATETLIGFASRLLADEPDLLPLFKDRPELMVVHEGLGVPATPAQLIASTFTAALEEMYYLGLPENETEYQHLVVKNLTALKIAAGGRQVELYEVVGLTGVELPAGRVLATPWGQLRGVKRRGLEYGGLEQFVRAITLVLCVPRHVSIPIVPPPVPQIPIGPWKTSEESQVLGLLALAFVLASIDAQRVAPMAVWSTTVPPFASGGGYSVRSPLVPATLRPTLEESGCSQVEDWCRLLEERRHLRPGTSIAGARLVSAVTGRTDLVDRLVDAVVAWENLVGAEGETTFRVTGALAKLIEDDPSKRAALARRLKGIYTLRSRAVHGAEVDQNKLKDAVGDAVDFGIAGLRRLYAKDPEWLKLDSTMRANRLLLEEP